MMEGSIHEIIYLDGTRQVPPTAGITNVISSSPEDSKQDHTSQCSLMRVLILIILITKDHTSPYSQVRLLTLILVTVMRKK